MDFEKITYGVKDGIASVLFNFPERRNALRSPMISELGIVLDEAENNKDVGALILSGVGDHFSAGGDMGAANGEPTVEASMARMQSGTRIAKKLLNFRKPVIAAVDGCAFGAGFSFALAADIVIATTRARFCMAFMRLGLVPDAAALFTLPRMVGMQRAKELIYSAREIDARTALDYGLVLEVVEPEALRTRAAEIASALKGHSELAFSMVKGALLRSTSTDLDAMLESEITAQSVAFSSQYSRMVGTRFREKKGFLFQWPASGSRSA